MNEQQSTELAATRIAFSVNYSPAIEFGQIKQIKQTWSVPLDVVGTQFDAVVKLEPNSSLVRVVIDRSVVPWPARRK